MWGIPCLWEPGDLTMQWLLARTNGTTKYLKLEDGRTSWVEKESEAMRFARHEDALQFAMFFSGMKKHGFDIVGKTF